MNDTETPCAVCGTCGPLNSREMADGPDGMCSTCRKNSDCPGRVELASGATVACGDEGRLCDACSDAEAKKWARYFGQGHGTPAQKVARLAAMKPEMKREADYRSDAEIEAEVSR